MSIELSYEELDSYIQQACTGQKLVYVDNHQNDPVALLFKHPSPDVLFRSQLHYDLALRRAKREGLPTLEEMEELIKVRGIYTEADELKVRNLKSKIEGQRSILKKTIRVPARRDRLYSVIEKLETQIKEIAAKKEPTLALTQERKAAEEKYLFLTEKGVFDPHEGDLFWKTTAEFEDEADFLFRKKVFLEYVIFTHGITSEIVRCVARSNLWRVRYVTALKTGDALFGCPIRDYNTDQLTLLYWSHFYQSIYEMLATDRPPDTIIEDDQALDAYMKDWAADKNRDTTAARAQQSNKYGNSSAWDHGETLVMKSNPVHADVQYSETLAEKSSTGPAAQVDAAPMGREARKTNLDKVRESIKKN